MIGSIRDYDSLLNNKSAGDVSVTPGLPGVAGEQGVDLPRSTLPRVSDDARGRRITFQVWDWADDGRSYAVNQFFMRKAEPGWSVTHYVSRFRALRRDELSNILRSAEFSEIRWHMPAESGFYQPIVTARNGPRDKS